MKRTSFAATLLALVIAACQQAQDDSNIAIDEVNNLATSGDIESLPPSEESGAPVDLDSGSDAGETINEAEDSGSEGPATLFIPAQYRGRWGLVAADCTSTRGDAKGLMTVGDTSIRFYESTAALQEQRPAIATSFSGTFAFTGEGQTWERVMTLTRTDNTLKRAQADDTFTYTRCA
ncbi:MAG: hypothetical protein M3Q83_00165 [Pseudomonadota bacterium]|nr:hypothetical protein [Pseudomonadota bacterium]